MLEVGCTKCPRYSRYQLNKLIAMHGPNCGLPNLIKFVSWDRPTRHVATVEDDPRGARCRKRASVMSEPIPEVTGLQDRRLRLVR
jgi:hypothetical protein